jgi:hypothetical protein
MNNQFSGPNAWAEYLSALEQATPVIEAIAVTDYYVTDTYEEVLRHKAEGRLPGAKLVFPNVELRLDVATAKGGFVNLHLFVSPENPQHLDELQRLLSRLQFNAALCINCHHVFWLVLRGRFWQQGRGSVSFAGGHGAALSTIRRRTFA